MSDSIAKVYTDAIRKHERVLYGVWNPGFPIQIGDFGVMRGNIFVRLGSISGINELKNFQLQTRKDPTLDEKFFTSQRGVEYEIKPQVSATVSGVPVNASIDIKFTKEDAIFFNAAECETEMLENKYQLGQDILALYKQSKDKWKREWVVVTDRVVSKRSLILVSTSSSFEISLEADASVPKIDLGKASLGLSVKSQKSTGYKVITEEGLVLLIGVSKVKSSFLWFDKKFNPMAKKYSVAMAEAIHDSEQITTENPNDLTFGQFTDDMLA